MTYQFMKTQTFILMLMIILSLIAVTIIREVQAASVPITAKVVVTGNVIKNETKANEANIEAEEKDFIRTIINFIKEIFLKIF